MLSWRKARLIQNEVVGPDLHRLALEVPSPVAAAFHTPGQYHRLRIDEEAEAFFAIASAPSASNFEYLVRATGGVASQWTSLSPGAMVEVRLPEGPGFPLERVREGKHNLLLIGTGTGFAPLRSVLHTIRQQRSQFGQVHGVYGVLTPAHLAFAPELAEWAAAGMHVVPTVTTSSADWKGAVGLVQQLLGSLPIDERTIAFLAGQPEMVKDVTGLLGKLGLPLNRVFLNIPL